MGEKKEKWVMIKPLLPDSEGVILAKLVKIKTEGSNIPLFLIQFRKDRKQNGRNRGSTAASVKFDTHERNCLFWKTKNMLRPRSTDGY